MGIGSILRSLCETNVVIKYGKQKNGDKQIEAFDMFFERQPLSKVFEQPAFNESKQVIIHP